MPPVPYHPKDTVAEKYPKHVRQLRSKANLLLVGYPTLCLNMMDLPVALFFVLKGYVRSNV